MPKQRITKEMVLEAAFELLRKGGEEEVLVKNIAAALSCSVQPIYSYCDNMDALKLELSNMAAGIMRKYISRLLDRDNLFESTGRAYIAFAKEEPHLFKSYFLRNRKGISGFDDLYAAEAGGGMAEYLVKSLGISESSAKELHMNMIIYTNGLSFILISVGGGFPQEELDEKLIKAYHAFLAAAQREGK